MEPQSDAAPPSGPTRDGLAAFRACVQQDKALQAELAAVPATEFLLRVKQAAERLGFELSPGVVEAEMNAARHRWIVRGVR